jgi:hypothetical protein
MTKRKEFLIVLYIVNNIDLIIKEQKDIYDFENSNRNRSPYSESSSNGFFKQCRLLIQSIFTPLRIYNAQSASPSPLITAHEVGVLNEKRCKKEKNFYKDLMRIMLRYIVQSINLDVFKDHAHFISMTDIFVNNFNSLFSRDEIAHFIRLLDSFETHSKRIQNNIDNFIYKLREKILVMNI